MKRRISLSAQALRWLAIADLVGIPALILLFIWRWQFTHFDVWIIFPLWLAASFLLHRDTPKTMGLRVDNLRRASIESGIFFGTVAVVFLGMALARGLPRNLTWQGAIVHLWAYFLFCFVQQIALNSLLNNRAISLFRQPWLSSLVACVAFASAHWPNPVLVPITLAGGFVMAWLFRRQRNIFTLALGQAIAGSLLSMAFPAAWIHNLRVGPGYYQWK